MSKRLASELYPRPTEPIPLEFERREFQPVQCGSPPDYTTRWYEPHPPLYRPVAVTPEDDSEILVPGTPERPEPYNFLETQEREDLEDLLEIPDSRTGFEDQRGYFPHEEDEEEAQPTVNLHVSWDGLVTELQSDSECETEMETDSDATELEDPDPFWDHVRMTHYRMATDGRLVPDEQATEEKE